jgi:hypothetical protein
MGNRDDRSAMGMALGRHLLRGMWLALGASHRMSVAERLRRKGEHARALETALAGLELLRDPSVLRFAPGPFVEVIDAAKLVHELAMSLDRPEDAVRPLEEALDLLDRDGARRGGRGFEPLDRWQDEDYEDLRNRLHAVCTALEQPSRG